MPNKDYPFNLMTEVLKESFPEKIPPDARGSVEYALSSFCAEREAEMLRLYYRDNKDLATIGTMHDLTRERVRQLLTHGIFTLRRSPAREYLVLGVKGVIAAEVKARHDEMFGRTKTSPVLIFEGTNRQINELGLSSRTFNALARIGISCTDDIARLGYRKLTRVRNLGEKSIGEIVKVMRELGYETDDWCFGSPMGAHTKIFLKGD